jgi:cyclic pyranopterin phosphate synthase
VARYKLPLAGETLSESGPSVFASPFSSTSDELTDRYGRRHNNLRISVTDRCNLRCLYCMPEEVVFLPRQELLSFEEITTFVEAVLPLGIDKIRLTGGEPLLRKDLYKLVRMLAALPGLRDLSLTTNGLLLKEQAPRLYEAGLRRINISLDTLDPQRFRLLTRRDGLERVLSGIQAVRQLGFSPIKINMVALRAFAERDLVPLARLCRDWGLELRIIEYMPIGAEEWERDKVVTAEECLQWLEESIAPLRPIAHDPTSPALEYEYLDGRGRVGIIASISRPFCRHCNRLRLTAEGKLRYCLFALEETDIKPFLRRNPPDLLQIQQLVRETVWAKWPGHQIHSAEFVKPQRTMHAIGG